MSQERNLQDAKPRVRCVGTLDALLRVRQDMLRGRLFIHIGDALVERLGGYIEGYRDCMRRNELPDELYAKFYDWLRNTKKEVSVEASLGGHPPAHYEDHEREIARFLELVAEFAANHSQQNVASDRDVEVGCSGQREGPNGVLPCLLEIRENMRQELSRAHLKDVNVERFNAFVDGYESCMDFNGLVDRAYVLFRDWLRDVKRELPAEGWPAGYLRDCYGDHQQAIYKYLDLVAEFTALCSDGTPNSSG